MVSSSPSVSFAPANTIDAMKNDDCQLQRISAFKDKVADLRATTKVYNIKSDVSINTLDSSLATKTVDSSSSSDVIIVNHRNDDGDGDDDPRKSSVDLVVRSAGKTLSESAAVISRLSSMEEKRNPVEEDTEEEEEEDDVDDGSSGSGGFSVESVESHLSPPANCISGDDEDDDDEGDEGESKDSFDGALFSQLRNAMFKRNTVNSISGDDEKDNYGDDDDDDDEGDSKDSFDGALFSQLRNAMFKRNTMNNDLIKYKEEEEEKSITPESRPEVVVNRSVSQSSKQSIADSIGVSTYTHSTSGGFSIECIDEDGSNDSVKVSLQREDDGTVEVDSPKAAPSEQTKSPEPEPINDKFFSGLSITSSLSSRSKPVACLLANEDDGATDEGVSHQSASRRLRELVAIISQDDFLEKATSIEPIDKLFSGISVNSSLSSTSKAVASLPCSKEDCTTTDEGNVASRRLRELLEQRRKENITTAVNDVSRHEEQKHPFDGDDERTAEDNEKHNASQRLQRLIAIGKECIDDGSSDSKGSALSEQQTDMVAAKVTADGHLLDDEEHIGDMEVRGSATEISHIDSMSSMTEQPPKTTATPQEEVVLASSSNPFAVLLKLRQARKMAVSSKLPESVGSINLGPSSDEDSSMSSLSAFKIETERKPSPAVYTDTDRAGDILDRVLFSNLKQSLSKIQSVDYEESYETTDEDEEGAPCQTENVNIEEEEKEEGTDRQLAGIASSVVVEEMESCAISSLKDETFAIRYMTDNCAAMNDDPFLDDDDDDDEDDDVNSVPTSPAALEDYHQFQMSNDSIYSNSFDSVLVSVESGQQDGNKTKSVINDNKARRGLVSNDDDGDTVAFSNSNKVDFMNQKERETILTPPKKNVIISDGSVFTKDSILGKTINVATADLASERIFLESLRAQVLAELKVHVADEEIRSALDARLQAIQNYYKRKATVVTLSKVTNATASSCHDYDEFLNTLGKIPKVQRTAVHGNKVEMSQAQSSSQDVKPSQQLQHHSYQVAFERAQGKMDEALRAAHNKKRNSSDFPEVEEEEENAIEATNSSHSETESNVHEQIFMKDTFWDDEDDPSTSAGSPRAEAVDCDRPPTHTDTIQNAWNFYRDINNLIFDSRVYDYEFQLIQDDPLYPYLDSLMGVADSGEISAGQEQDHISQKVKAEYADKSPHRICHILAKEANDALPELKEICAYLGEKLGMQTMAVGPMKKPSEALLKCERKYGGDPLLVLDYCRASLFVKDIATLLALIEIVLSEYGQILRRIKLSSLKSDHVPLTGGYRDCKINLDIGGHICEIQVHLIPLWLIKEGSGYRHYKKCCDHSVNISSFDIGKTLDGLSRSVLSDLIDIAKYELKSTPILSLHKHSEDKIRDYFALACMYQCYGQPAKAEYILRRTVKLRSESSAFGLCHTETMLHLEVLRKSLKSQHKYKSSMKIKSQITKMKRMQRRGDVEPDLFQLCSEDQCGALDHLCDMIIDPSKSERRREKQKARDIEESRALWLRMRKSFFG